MPLRTLLALVCLLSVQAKAASHPNIILVMTDDQGWGQTGYYNHPVLKTPNLDAMAANGIRFDRFYAGAANCSPTRATVMTGRTNDRTGVQTHGYAMSIHEKTVAQALKSAGYTTAHFGKWHLNGLRGAGIPILKTDAHHPGHFGFDYWLSVTNFFDRNPIMSRIGTFEEFKGDSSEIVVDEALKFIGEKSKGEQPFFTVIWFGTPHSPFVASEQDKKPFPNLKEASQNHYGELVAMDRSIGTLRSGLRKLGIEDNTLIWFNSDNGGLKEVKPGSVGHLRGFKNTLYEGGLRVPAIVEWPAAIPKGQVTDFHSGTVDIFPTIAEIVGLPESSMLKPVDGISLLNVLKGSVDEDAQREQPLFFRHTGRGAMVAGDYKLVIGKVSAGKYELFNLNDDPSETTDLKAKMPKVAESMWLRYQQWNKSVDASVSGADYPGGTVDRSESDPRWWKDADKYRKYFPEWKNRPEYQRYLK